VRCRFFRTRIYNETNIDPTFAAERQVECPFEGGDDNLSAFDSTTPFKLDNTFYQNLLQQKGLVHSDQQLFANIDTDNRTKDQVISYSNNVDEFKKDFADAMVKMSIMTPLTDSDGQIRENCRLVNAPSI